MNLVGPHEVQFQICCKQYLPSVALAPSAEKQSYITFPEFYIHMGIMASVASAVSDFFLTREFLYNLLGIGFSIFGGPIFCV